MCSVVYVEGLAGNCDEGGVEGSPDWELAKELVNLSVMVC